MRKRTRPTLLLPVQNCHVFESNLRSGSCPQKKQGSLVPGVFSNAGLPTHPRNISGLLSPSTLRWPTTRSSSPRSRPSEEPMKPKTNASQEVAQKTHGNQRRGFPAWQVAGARAHLFQSMQLERVFARRARKQKTSVEHVHSIARGE